MSDSFQPMFGNPIADWHWKFTWLPINTLDRGWIWLKFIKRRRIAKHKYLDGGSDFWWQYKAV